ARSWRCGRDWGNRWRWRDWWNRRVDIAVTATSQAGMIEINERRKASTAIYCCPRLIEGYSVCWASYDWRPNGSTGSRVQALDGPAERTGSIQCTAIFSKDHVADRRRDGWCKAGDSRAVIGIKSIQIATKKSSDIECIIVMGKRQSTNRSVEAGRIKRRRRLSDRVKCC